MSAPNRFRGFWKSGDPFIWLSGGTLAINLVLVAGLVLLVLVNGLGFFWPKDLIHVRLPDGREILGQVVQREAIPDPGAAGTAPARHRIKIKQGNRDLYGVDFVWVDEAEIATRSAPPAAVALERNEWGDLYGTLGEVREGGTAVAAGPEASWAALHERLPGTTRTTRRIRRIERREIGAINQTQESLRLRLRGLELRGVTVGPEVDRIRRELATLAARYDGKVAEVGRLRDGLTASVLVVAAGGMEKEVPLAQIVRVWRPNAMGPFAKSGHYLAKLWEFVSDDPRESNTEGGVLPAIFGTVLMVFLMSLLVTPFGVLAAFYLREYAKQGPLVSAVRIAVNNLAGVPSIVFGVFGVGFFIYFVGGAIDRAFYPEALPTPTFGTGGILWASLTLALLTVPVVIVSTEEGLAAIPRGLREASLALGATKFETTRRIVLPAVMPSILTGLILAMARAAGEVAPLMITGVVKLAPTLPVDGQWPFLHLNRKFMHLGFHIYDVGFQSPNVDAARPMVFTTTVLLLGIVLLLNLGAIALRNRLRKKFSLSSL
ncbi:MAG: phosphate ABC transporter permease PstA [Candidatus Polarisedimenticolia bacterium]